MSISSDFDFFAEDRAVKKEPDAEIEVKKEEPIKVSPMPRPTPKLEKKDFVERPKTKTYPANRYQAAPKAERRMYPERVFDQYAFKRIQIREEDYELLGQLERAISHAKRQLPEELKSNQRITANTLIRTLIQEFCSNLQQNFDELDFSSLQLEENIQTLIQSYFRRD